MQPPIDLAQKKAVPNQPINFNFIRNHIHLENR